MVMLKVGKHFTYLYFCAFNGYLHANDLKKKNRIFPFAYSRHPTQIQMPVRNRDIW